MKAYVKICICPKIDAGETQHRTKAASEKQHDLWCYRCDTMVDGDRCLDLIGNFSHMHAKCTKEQKKCQVRRISMSTSTDEITGKPKLWLLQRNCSEVCEPGCIVIGERTKLHSCITCCDEHNYCNADSGSYKVPFSGLNYLINFTYLFPVLYINN
ncbi:hypothetical protein NQ315_014023 [Exocentrus adspersus]|uniref:Uncharacterized protein n=1 Tax=Exocentrus adspersus TaxID=1586481 RepID=A0AAV8VBV0_9CUCU|nr:hypothetical protein NQ315_014023 [Exocentrus adspersus]